MDCKKFQYWLTHRDIHEKDMPPDIVGHMTDCPQCKQLFETDNFLEQSIAGAVQQEELPGGIALRINDSLDKTNESWLSRLMEQKKKIALATAALAAGFILVIFFLPGFQSTRPFETLDQISRHAAARHLTENHQINFDTQHTHHALAMMTKKLGFEVILPDPSQLECNVLGCHLCAIGECQAAYFAVEKNGRPGSLFIMGTDRIQFDMADGARFNTSVQGCEASIWKEHGQIYAMIF